MLRYDYLPDSFMLTMLVPLLKSKTGDITNTCNYCPIALSIVCLKIMEKCLLSRFEHFLYTNDYQFAYKREHSTCMCIYLLNEAIRLYTKHCSPIYACSLHASKVFPK